MTNLVLGPLLRHVDTRSATVWVETDAPCVVEVASAAAQSVTATAHTFTVAGHHYALVTVTGLEPGTSTPYRVRLDGAEVWPLPGTELPPSRIRTFPDGGDPRFLMLFGSCRLPETADPAERRKAGTDALAAYARRMAGQDERDWPDSLMLLGDQVYADETSRATREWLKRRRDTSKPPGFEVADFAEYVRLYHEAWSTTLLRWLLSTVPTSMIFDDHDVSDDWNTSQAWREAKERTSWWRARERGALVSYWIYQHLGNLGPDELATDETYKAVLAAGRDGDAEDVLLAFADRADEEVNGRKGTRWSYRRDFGNVRLLVIDTRSGRILSGGARSMDNRVPAIMRPIFRLAWWRPLAAVLYRRMLRSKHIEPLPVAWDRVSGPFFGNAIAALRTSGRHAELVVERADASNPAGDPRLVPLATVRLRYAIESMAARTRSSTARRHEGRSRRHRVDAAVHAGLRLVAGLAHGVPDDDLRHPAAGAAEPLTAPNGSQHWSLFEHGQPRYVRLPWSAAAFFGCPSLVPPPPRSVGRPG